MNNTAVVLILVLVVAVVGYILYNKDKEKKAGIVEGKNCYTYDCEPIECSKAGAFPPPCYTNV